MTELNTETVSGEVSVPVQPARDGTADINIMPTQAFSVYNREGSLEFRTKVEEIYKVLKAEVYADQPRPEVIREEPKPAEVPCACPKCNKNVKKNVFPTVLALILSGVAIAALALGFFSTVVTDYVAPFAVNGTAVAFADFAYLLKAIFIDKIVPIGGSMSNMVHTYAWIAFIALYAILTVALFFTALAALCGKKKCHGYKRVRFGGLSFAVFVFGVMAVLMTNQLFGSFSSVGDVLKIFTVGQTIKSGLGAQYALYGYLAIPFITFICGCCAYKKVKKNKCCTEEAKGSK